MGLLDSDPFAPAPAEPEVLPDPFAPVLAAIDQLAAAIREMRAQPAPVVQVPPVDLTEVVMAVQALKGPATAEEIALALRAVLQPDRPAGDGTAAVLEKLAERLEALDFRLKGRGVTTGGGFASLTVNGAPVSSSNPIPTSAVARGAWGYLPGTSGTETVTGGKRVTRITAIALGAAGSLTINDGASIVLPYDATDNTSSSIVLEPAGDLTDPVIVFTDTDGYLIEYVT